MPALAPPPPTIRHPVARPQLELPAVSFFGRTLAEYTQFFALDVVALRGRDVLDVAAGPASFVAEACARRINAAAVDPLYGSPPDDLATRVQSDYHHMFAQMRANPGLFKVSPATMRRPEAVEQLSAGPPQPVRTSGFSSIDDAETDRRAAAQRFLADYATQFLHGRYVGGALPRLPFLGCTFDLVLCAHLLFVHAARFDFEWHLAACRELVRVSAGEVRIHPLCGADGKPYAGLARLRRELRTSGIGSEIVSVNYEFFTGSNSMLVLKRNSP